MENDLLAERRKWFEEVKGLTLDSYDRLTLTAKSELQAEFKAWYEAINDEELMSHLFGRKRGES